ncbi:MAG: hypothetical protein AAF618_10305, partial [Pseudomonadota bacterium]
INDIERRPTEYRRYGSTKRFKLFSWSHEPRSYHESSNDFRRRFDEASRFVDLDQLGIAPKCGFASTEEGNVITADDQRRKLELTVATAEAIWGGVAA